MPIRNILPRKLRAPLWGDRERWGLTPDLDDPSWQEWQTTYTKCYLETQREGIGTSVNNAGYKIISKIDLSGKRILEVGAGDIRHMKYWRGKPAEYVLADNLEGMMDFAKRLLMERAVPFKTLYVERNQPLALENESIDVIVSFYSMEHLYPLRPYLEEFKRLLKPGGCLIGAIPAEGGLAWGGGRMLTSHRWFKKHTTIEHNKIICWEHPNFADQILGELDQVFMREAVEHWPLPWLPLLDPNLVIRLLYRKSPE